MIGRLKTLLRRRQAYTSVFEGRSGEIVLADLRRFCHAIEPTADPNNPNATYLREGRREVYLRIMAMCNVTEDQLYSMNEGYNDENELD